MSLAGLYIIMSLSHTLMLIRAEMDHKGTKALPHNSRSLVKL